MRILFAAPFGLRPKYTVSGRALPLAQALVKRGHQVHVLIPPWDHPVDSGRQSTLGGVTVEHICLPRRTPGVTPCLIAWRLLRPAVSSHADVIHVFKPKGYSGCVAMLLWYLKRLGIAEHRLVVDTDDWEGPGGWNEHGAYSPVSRWLFAHQERWGLTHCDAVTVASRTLQSLAWSIGARRVHYLPNGLLDIPVLPPRQQARSRLGLGDAPVALVYTRFVEVSAGRLVSVLGDLLRRIASLRVLIVGEGLRGELDLVRRHLDGIPEGERAHPVGWIEQSDLPWYWAAADLALYPCEDNLLVRSKAPVRLLELMSAGLPVVAQRVGEAEEYVVHNVSGVLVSPGDDLEFAESVASLATDASLRSRLGEAARARIEGCYMWGGLVDRAIEAYEEAGARP